MFRKRCNVSLSAALCGPAQSNTKPGRFEISRSENQITIGLLVVLKMHFSQTPATESVTLQVEHDSHTQGVPDRHRQLFAIRGVA